MSKSRILVQLDSDSQASVFDAVVAVDAGVDHLLRHSDVQLSQVRELVYGAMFTRGGGDLAHNHDLLVDHLQDDAAPGVGKAVQGRDRKSVRSKAGIERPIRG